MVKLIVDHARINRAIEEHNILEIHMLSIYTIDRSWIFPNIKGE